MKNIFILLLLLLCAVLSMAQNNRVISEGSGSNQDLEYNSATRILSITNGTGDTLPVMLGATAGTAGEAGLVPKPLAGEENLFLRGDGTFANPSTGGDNWGSQVVQTTARLSGNGTAGSPLDISQQGAGSGQVLKWNGTAWAPGNDTDTDTDAQTLSLVTNTLSISGGNSVSLSSYLDNTDAQTLSLATNTLSISGGNGVSLAAYLDNTDAQTLSITEGTRELSISGGNTIDLSEGIQEEVNAFIVAGTGISKSYNDGGNSLTISSTVTDTDDQTLSLVGTLLSISDGNSVDIAAIDTDDQTLSLSSNTLSISGGNGVSLAEYLDNTDAQTLSLAGSSLSISGGNSVNLSGINTDAQTLSLAGSSLSISGGNSVNLSALSSTDGNGIVSALPAGDVVVAAAGNGLVLNNLDTFSVEATAGIMLKSEDIWFSQASPNSVDLHLALFTNFVGNGYLNISTPYINNTVDDSLSIILDNISADKKIRINNQLEVDKYGGFELANFPATFSLYGPTDEGKIVYNETAKTPMFWTGTAFENLVGASNSSTPMNYLEVGASSISAPNFSTSFSKLTHLTAGDDSGADWSWSTGTDAATYSGATKVGLIHFSVSFFCNSTFNPIHFVIRENGSETMAKAIGETTESGVTQTVNGVAIVTFNNGDTFELGGYTGYGTSLITVTHANMVFYSFN
ncbi:hypothetical protein KC887_00725 [Candidatus Kaiserbacteria bacterium]|nr:hypothetical protein [Candidatus Kaiserbacteria bacterium]